MFSFFIFLFNISHAFCLNDQFVMFSDHTAVGYIKSTLCYTRHSYLQSYLHFHASIRSSGSLALMSFYCTQTLKVGVKKTHLIQIKVRIVSFFFNICLSPTQVILVSSVQLSFIFDFYLIFYFLYRNECMPKREIYSLVHLLR